MMTESPLVFDDAAARAGLSGRCLAGLAAVAAILFLGLFATHGIGRFDFWWWMAVNALAMIGLGLKFDASFSPHLRGDIRRGRAGKLALGVGSAAALYGIFYAGNGIVRVLWGEQAGQGIDQVYALKNGVPMIRVALIIAFLIGPAEELFWRGLLQRQLTARYGPAPGVLGATILYAGVHLASGNPMLILAALVCGAFWGALYAWKRSVWTNVISHTLWDLAVFIFLPLR
jgi:membrane protease YdiL (CAAX protease family)